MKKLIFALAFGALLSGLYCEAGYYRKADSPGYQEKRDYYDNAYPGLSKSEIRYYRNYCEGSYDDGDRGDSVAKGAFGGAIAGTAIGGIAGGGRGAGIGAATGLGLGALLGASSGGRSYPRRCRRLDRKMRNFAD